MEERKRLLYGGKSGRCWMLGGGLDGSRKGWCVVERVDEAVVKAEAGVWKRLW